ncbi:MAG: hypothetical protein KF784_05880 [Fimbriimonadaceae bacterium]|nr:hypothetical protein [Fimbriimonadaceae bacterium]
MSKKDIIVAIVLVAIFGVVCYVGLIWIFDTSHEEQLARSLIGKPWSEVEPAMGKPRWKYDAKTFNEVERANILHSFSPKDIPTANGEVMLFNPPVTLIILYEKDGKVEKVYVGRT